MWSVTTTILTTTTTISTKTTTTTTTAKPPQNNWISLVSFKVTFYLLFLLLFYHNHPLTQTKCATPWWVSPCVKVFSPTLQPGMHDMSSLHYSTTVISTVGADYSPTPVLVLTTPQLQCLWILLTTLLLKSSYKHSSYFLILVLSSRLVFPPTCPQDFILEMWV